MGGGWAWVNPVWVHELYLYLPYKNVLEMMELDLMQLICCFLNAGLTLAPLVMKVDPNLNVILTASLTVFVGCYRSVKPTPPSVSTAAPIFIILTSSTTFVFLHLQIKLCEICYIMQETMSNEHAMRFPFVGSAMLLSLFLLFKFLSKDLVNAVLTCYFFVLGIVALSYVPSI